MKAVFLALSAMLIAGCVEAGPSSTTFATDSTGTSAPPIHASSQAPQATATESLGAMKVTVVTTEVAPVGAAQVLVDGLDRTEFTDEAGVATFSGLDPGSYTVLTAKPGYRAQEERGRLVTVVAEEVAEVRLTLDPIPVVDADSAYYLTTPLTGFISCAVEGWPGPGNIGYTTYCGRGLQTAAGSINDPNDKSLFVVPIENVHIESLVFEAMWEPNNAVTSPQLRVIWATGLQCGTTGCVMTSNQKINMGGVSPLRGSFHEGSDANFTSRFGLDPAAYPVKTYVEARAFCATNCTFLGITVQQDFDLWVTMFYGRAAAAEFSAMPTA